MDLHRPDASRRLGEFMPRVPPHDCCRRAQLSDRAQARLARAYPLRGVVPMTETEKCSTFPVDECLAPHRPFRMRNIGANKGLIFLRSLLP